MAERKVDFLSQYKAISSKLKKRFLRKPNVAEASEQFSFLAKQLQEQDCPKYAGFTCLALAKCEQSIGNPSGEAQALLQGARLYMKEEQENYDLGCQSLDENLNSAIHCYNNAMRVYLEQKHTSLAASVCLEVANGLKRLGKTSESIGYYVRAAELYSKSPVECLNVMDDLASCHIEIGDFDRSLNFFSDMARLIDEQSTNEEGDVNYTGIFSDLAAKVEISRVLLLLILRPGPQRLNSDQSQLLEKYAWESTDFDASAALLGDDLFLLLQSLVMAHQSSDYNSLVSLQADLWPFFTPQQNDLLNLVVTKFQHPDEL